MPRAITLNYAFNSVCANTVSSGHCRDEIARLIKRRFIFSLLLESLQLLDIASGILYRKKRRHNIRYINTYTFKHCPDGK